MSRFGPEFMQLGDDCVGSIYILVFFIYITCEGIADNLPIIFLVFLAGSDIFKKDIEYFPFCHATYVDRLQLG